MFRFKGKNTKPEMLVRKLLTGALPVPATRGYLLTGNYNIEYNELRRLLEIYKGSYNEK